MTTTQQPIGRMTLKNVRLAFPNLFEATTVGGEGKPRYSAVFLLDANDAQIPEIRRKMQAVAKEKWGAKAVDVYKGIEKADKLALHDGDTKSQYDGFAGGMFVNAASQESARPTVVKPDRTPLVKKDGMIYAGCYVNALVEFWAQDNNYGKRVNATLRGVQFLRDGDAFSADRPADADEFEAATEGAGAEDFG